MHCFGTVHKEKAPKASVQKEKASGQLLYIYSLIHVPEIDMLILEDCVMMCIFQVATPLTLKRARQPSYQPRKRAKLTTPPSTIRVCVCKLSGNVSYCNIILLSR